MTINELIKILEDFKQDYDGDTTNVILLIYGDDIVHSANIKNVDISKPLYTLKGESKNERQNY